MNSTASLMQEFLGKARALGLSVDCSMDGVFNAQVAIVAEAPGSREVSMKIPLIGGSGQLLWSTLKRYNITRREVYITNVVKRQLTFAGSDDKARMPKVEFDNWVSLLKWELAHLPNLRYVLVLGNMALEALCGKRGITKWRGSVLDFEILSLASSQPRTYRAVCTFNPAWVLREPRHEISFIMDVGKLPRVVTGNWREYPIEATINPTCEEALTQIGLLEGSGDPVSFDIEVGARETACVGLANDPHRGICIPFRGIRGEPTYTAAEELAIRMRLQRLFGNEDIRFVAQNAQFDMYWLWYKDKIRVHRTWFDTLLAHHCLYPTLPHDLGYLTTQYTTHPYYKDEREEWKDKGDIDQFWKYNVRDCCVTLAVSKRLLVELKAQGLTDFYFSHVMRLQPHLVRMTVGGILVDTAEKTRVATDLQEDVARLLEEFHKSVAKATGLPDYRPNPLSPHDLSQLFFQHLRLVGRGTSTDAANRKRMYDHPRTTTPSKEVLRHLDEYKEEQKFLSTYAETSIDEDNRIRCEWKQFGTQSAPGRLSSSKTLWGTGMNLQNQPSRAKSMYIADPGYCFVYFDLSQAEARFVGWEAGIEKWIEQFEKARLDGVFDCHRALAAEMFDVPYDEVPTSDENADGSKSIRYIAKRCRHGLNYRMAPARLAETTGLSMSRAYEAYSLYHRTTPELRPWWGRLEREVRDTKCLFNAFGRRLRILERITEESLESIVAFKPQSTVGDKVCQVIYQCHDDDKWPASHARIVLNVHDALVAIAHLDKAKTCLSVMKKWAESPINIKGRPLIIPADLAMSQPTSIMERDGLFHEEPDPKGRHRWSSLKKLKRGEIE